MPGKPLLRAFESHVHSLGGDDVVFELIAEGKKMEDVAATFRGFMESRPEFPSRPFIYTWIRSEPDRYARFKALRKAQADDAYDQIDDLLFPEDESKLPVIPAEAAVLRERVSHLRKKASVFDPEGYGEKQAGVDVNISIQDLHLDALRAAGSMDQVRGGEEPRVIEGEVVE